MHLNIYTDAIAAHIDPGAIVDGGDKGHVLVDETRNRMEDGHLVVSLYGTAPGANARRRVHLRYSAGEKVRVVPTEDTAAEAWINLLDAVALAERTWREDHADDGAAGRPPWSVDTDRGNQGAAMIRLGSTVYAVEAGTDPEPGISLPPDDDPDDDPAAG